MRTVVLVTTTVLSVGLLSVATVQAEYNLQPLFKESSLITNATALVSGPLFGTKVGSQAGLQPLSVHPRELDGHDHDDQVVANGYSSESSLLLDDGDRVFPPSAELVIGERGMLKPIPPHSLFGRTSIRLYQTLISPSKGTGCPMRPHCSQYCMTAFERFNPIKAWLITADRLHRCGHDLAYYDQVSNDGNVSFIDSTLLEVPSHANMSVGRNGSRHTGEMVHVDDEPRQDVEPPNEVIREPNVHDSPDGRLWSFANGLMMEGHSSQAIVEYKRLLKYYPQTALVRPVSLSIFRCLIRTGEYLEAIHWGQQLIAGSDSSYYQREIGLGIGTCFLTLGNFGAALDYLQRMNVQSDTEIEAERNFLSSVAYSNQLKWRRAKAHFQKIPPESKWFDRAERSIYLCDLGMNTRPKSPAVAGILSIVPGLGYLYSGFEQTALSAFVVNTLFFWGTYEAFDRGNDGVGSLLTILSLGWYSGGIYGSIACAKRRNDYENRRLQAEISVGICF